ncbi:MAG: UxaA family hydrolase [Candidatus Fimivivens sp.]
MKGYKRADGRIGIRNHVAIIYTVKCAEHVAKKISQAVDGTQVFGYDSCYPDPYGFRVIAEMAKHPNIASVIFVKLGCESSPVSKWVAEVQESGKDVHLLEIQTDGGTVKTIEKGIKIATCYVEKAKETTIVEIGYNDLIIGVECGGSDATSGLAANPVTGNAMDKFIASGGICIFSELPELLGTDRYILEHAKNDTVREDIKDGLYRAQKMGNLLKTFAVSAGNEKSGLTTIEEKSLGALCKAGSSIIEGVIKTAERPEKCGLYLQDKIGTVDSNQLTIYEESDNDGFAALIASGAHIIIFTTGCGNVVGSVVSPVIKVCGNPQKIAIMGDDFDIDASPVVQGANTIDKIGDHLMKEIRRICEGGQTRAEDLGHEEYHILRKFVRACDVKYIV